MDMETVLPFKTVNDIIKEVKETNLLSLTEEKQCGCGHCSCGGDV
jgi:DNA polymerase III sliding clamp (beta) subunit (PCNA family)